ncbi:hypothetical protein AMS68_001698 [Peltaster fructicola]|uniref:Uncharacterized protein n=1 Tax=Peltaster fructicola TaxID=286661 RepID=A0A6H0XNF1_9PEZI|nr:hypothetical protein AMS68_001698 [Peltaster fructicola]
MPLRERAKNLFKRRSSRSDTLSKTSSKESSRDRWPSNVYKPGEPMPRPKYRRPPEKAHKDKLDAFSFGEAWRRKSYQSQHSPMGTRLPSRRNSFLSFRKGIASRNASRNASIVSNSDKGGSKHTEDIGPSLRPALSPEVEQYGDDDVANVGGSHLRGRERDLPSPPRTAAALSSNNLSPTRGTARDHQPFSEDDLALAMKRSHLTVPTQ